MKILAVGDMNFQKKCFAKMEEFKRNKVTIILVSHNLNAVAKFCDKCIWLQDGVIKSSGKSKSVIEEYLSFMSGKQDKSNKKDNEKYTNEAEIVEFKITDSDNESVIGREIKSGIGINPIIKIKKLQTNGKIKAEILLSTADDQLISVIDSEFITLKKDETQTLKFQIKSLPLSSGVYTIKAVLKTEEGTECCKRTELNINVQAEYDNIGIFNLDFTCKKVD